MWLLLITWHRFAVQAVHLTHLWQGLCSGLQGCSVSGLNVLKQTVTAAHKAFYNTARPVPVPPHPARETLWTRDQLSVLPAGAQVFSEPSAGPGGALRAWSLVPRCVMDSLHLHFSTLRLDSRWVLLPSITCWWRCVCVCVVGSCAVRVRFCWWFCSWSQCWWLLAVSCFLLWCCSCLHVCYCCVVLCCVVLCCDVWVLFGTVGSCVWVLGWSETHAVILLVCLLWPVCWGGSHYVTGSLWNLKQLSSFKCAHMKVMILSSCWSSFWDVLILYLTDWRVQKQKHVSV